MSAISEKYQSLGDDAIALGEPKALEQSCPDGVGRHRHYQGGSIHWSPDSGAHVTRGVIQKKWAALNWEVGPLGYPVSDEEDCPGGRYSLFQGGTILWRQGTKEAFETHGAIRDKWASLGKETGLLGFPETDEKTCPDGTGKFQHFQNGSVYWTSTTGAHEVHGAIRSRWAELGWENGFLGYPISDEQPTPDGKGRYNDFQGGKITWTEAGGAQEKLKSFEPRLVKAIGEVDLVDHETVFADERSTVPIEVAERIEGRNTAQKFMRFKAGFGGEARFELDLNVVVRPDDSAVITGEARLFEGTSESTTSRVGSWPIDFTVPRNTTVAIGREVEGGEGIVDMIRDGFGSDATLWDTADVHLAFSNMPA